MIKSSRTTTKVSAVFLATVLIAGTMALSFPSFMIGSAQAQSYYSGGMDNRYNSYGSDYGNSYESDYGNDNSYGSDYGRDNDRKSYGNDYGDKSQYQSYKPDYKPQYPSYGKDKDDRDKFKDNKSVDIKKIKCNNININLNAGGNGDNGNTTNGDKGNKTDEFKKIDRDGFTFICINNNNNVAGGGNVTEPEPDKETCEDCFAKLTGRVLALLNAELETGFVVGSGPDAITVPPGTDIAELCALLEAGDLELTIQEVLAFINSLTTQIPPIDLTNAEIDEIFELLFCLDALGIIDLQFTRAVV